MRTYVLVAALVFCTFSRANAFVELTDYNKALDLAEAQHKYVLLDFTGSDWCGYCKLLDSEVFAQSEFDKFADSNLIFVTVDFPHGKSLETEVKQQNFGLKRKFQVHEFPTLIILNADAQEMGRITGYHPGSGPQAVMDEIRKLER